MLSFGALVLAFAPQPGPQWHCVAGNENAPPVGSVSEGPAGFMVAAGLKGVVLPGDGIVCYADGCHEKSQGYTLQDAATFVAWAGAGATFPANVMLVVACESAPWGEGTDSSCMMVKQEDMASLGSGTAGSNMIVLVPVAENAKATEAGMFIGKDGLEPEVKPGDIAPSDGIFISRVAKGEETTPPPAGLPFLIACPVKVTEM